MSIINLSPAQLRKAADLQEKIARLQSELTALVGGETKAAPAVAKPAAKKKGGMSAAGRAKVAAAQKARWAKIKAAKGKTAVVAPAKKARKKMSAEARAKIAAGKSVWGA